MYLCSWIMWLNCVLLQQIVYCSMCADAKLAKKPYALTRFKYIASISLECSHVQGREGRAVWLEEELELWSIFV